MKKLERLMHKFIHLDCLDTNKRTTLTFNACCYDVYEYPDNY